MSLGPVERAVLAGLADVLIPASGSFLAASDAGVHAEGLDRVLAARPDLEEPLRGILQGAAGRDPAAAVAALKAEDPAGFGVLCEVVSGAYFMNPRVRAAIGYDGQGPRPIDPRPEHLEDGLLQSVMDRGPIYRPTPAGPAG